METNSLAGKKRKAQKASGAHGLIFNLEDLEKTKAQKRFCPRTPLRGAVSTTVSETIFTHDTAIGSTKLDNSTQFIELNEISRILLSIISDERIRTDPSTKKKKK